MWFVVWQKRTEHEPVREIRRSRVRISRRSQPRLRVDIAAREAQQQRNKAPHTPDYGLSLISPETVGARSDVMTISGAGVHRGFGKRGLPTCTTSSAVSA